MSKRDTRRDRTITREIHRLFWRANFQSKGRLIITYLVRIPAVAFYNTLIPLVSAYAVQAIINRRFDAVAGYAWWIVALSVGYVILWGIGNIAIGRQAIIGSKYIQNAVFRNFLQKDYDFYANNLTGALGTQAARIRDAFNGYGELVTLQIPKQVTIVVAGVIVIALQAPLLALITLITIFFVLSYTLLSSSWRLQFRRRVSEASSEVAGHIGDALMHGTTVKSFSQEAYEERRLQAPLNRWGHEQYRSWLLYVPADGGRMLLAAMATAVLLVFSAHLYAAGKISITIVVLVQLYVIKLVASTLDIAEIVKRYEEIMGMAYEPVKTMLIPYTVQDPAKPQQLKQTAAHTLELKGVSYHYPEARAGYPAVASFSLTVHPGEKIGIVGYSGSGKTTLTKLLLRFMDVSSGQITIDSTDIRDMEQKVLRSIVSYVPQEPLLFHRSIAENIAYAKPEAGKNEILHAAKLAYLDEFVAGLPHGFDTLVGERGVKLSGGQRQRVAIARALLKNSPILVLDEATSALDSRSEKYVQDALWKLMKNRTALVIAHRLSTIQRMDRIVVMDKGRIIEVGTHEELLKNSDGIYAKLWAHQSGGYLVTQ